MEAGDQLLTVIVGLKRFYKSLVDKVDVFWLLPFHKYKFLLLVNPGPALIRKFLKIRELLCLIEEIINIGNRIVKSSLNKVIFPQAKLNDVEQFKPVKG